MKRLSLALGLATLSSVCSLTLGSTAGPTHHSGMLDTSEVWLASGNPHILDDDVYTGDSVTLTIMPGCTVQVSAGAELYTGYASPGSVVAVGNADSMITFTSLSDTVPGFWRSISFYSNTMSTARMSYCNVLFGGQTSDRFGAIKVDQTGIEFDHNVVRKSGYHGVCAMSTGYFDDFANNTIIASGAYPIRIYAEYVRTLGTDNVLTGNTKDGVLVHGGAVKTTGTWLNHGVPYVVDDDVAVQDATNSPVLTLAAGTTLKLTPLTEFYVGYSSPGGLIADGTSGQITFTSSVGSPAPGDWVSLSFYDRSMDAQCLLKNCVFEYGGAGSYGDIYIDNSTPTVTSCDIGYSSAYGIYLAGWEYPDPDLLRADNYIHDYVSGDINIPTGIEESPVLQVAGSESQPTLVHGVLFLAERPSASSSPSCLLDVGGRKVMDLLPGTNDVRALVSGVYFVRDEGQGTRDAGRTRKIVVTN